MTTIAPAADAGIRDALRLFKNDAAALRDPGPTLETTATPPEPPRVVDSRVIESTTVRAHRIVDAAEVGFSAFLDGAQESRAVHYVDGIPIVFGRTAAVVRQRVLRRMVTWKPPVTRARFYMPRALVPARVWDLARDNGYEITDTSDDAELAGDASSSHPFSIAQRALEAVQRDRAELERALAESWCVSQSEPVFIDGSIAGSDRVAAA